MPAVALSLRLFSTMTGRSPTLALHATVRVRSGDSACAPPHGPWSSSSSSQGGAPRRAPPPVGARHTRVCTYRPANVTWTSIIDAADVSRVRVCRTHVRGQAPRLQASVTLRHHPPGSGLGFATFSSWLPVLALVLDEAGLPDFPFPASGDVRVDASCSHHGAHELKLRGHAKRVRRSLWAAARKLLSTSVQQGCTQAVPGPVDVLASGHHAHVVLATCCVRPMAP